ncbi:hypothetical protein [Kitasatospora aureofaciens]|uniref:hypothetical protein n=1 Tax=Kitasatospora aureofaciens TaxID=1894 RepID=UPI000526B1BE|nr:hypothetical protein [Kitasatospora aureofaciens]
MPSALRVVSSAFQREDLDPEHAAAVEQAVEDGIDLRTSSTQDSYGQTGTEITVVSYTAPDGSERFAVRDWSGAGTEILDSDDKSAVVEYYEGTVRERAKDSGPWDVTDVEGQVKGRIAYTVETSTDGTTWGTVKSDKTTVAKLNGVTTYLGAAKEVADQEIGPVEEANWNAACSEASGYRPGYLDGAEVITMLRVRIEVDGDDVAEHVHAFPPVTPTPEQARQWAEELEAILRDSLDDLYRDFDLDD